ncbi:MAG: hypothetical protein WA571_03435, partial [Candidatus Binatus sp.]
PLAKEAEYMAATGFPSPITLRTLASGLGPYMTHNCAPLSEILPAARFVKMTELSQRGHFG